MNIFLFGRKKRTQKSLSYCIVEFFQTLNGEELVHVDPLVQKQPDKVHPVQLKCLLHGIVQHPVRPVLPVSEYLLLGNVRPVPGEGQGQLLGRVEVLGLEQSRQDHLVQLGGRLLPSAIGAPEDGDEVFALHALLHLLVQLGRSLGADVESTLDLALEPFRQLAAVFGPLSVVLNMPVSLHTHSINEPIVADKKFEI